MKKIVAQNEKVVMGVDVHTRSHVVAVKVGRELVQRVTLSAQAKAWRRYLERFPGCELNVVYESGPHGYNLYDWLMELDGIEGRRIHVHVAPPSMIPQAPGKRGVKTDRRDSVRLIQAWETASFRPVVVPEKRQRCERELVRTRDQLKKDSKRLKCRIHAMVKFHGLHYPAQRMWTPQWADELVKIADCADPSGALGCALKAKLDMHASIMDTLATLEKKIVSTCAAGPCARVAEAVMEHKGIGTTAASVIATEVADFAAFDNSGSFVSYTGLAPGARCSGETRHLGPITKAGNRRLRWVFIECAWIWIRYDTDARLMYEKLKIGRGSRKAIVATARRMAVNVYHLAMRCAAAA